MRPIDIMRMRKAASGGTSLPLLRSYASGTSVTETAPTGAANVVIEVWGGGGGGGHGSGTGCTGTTAFGGGSGAYSRASVAITAGQTLAYTVGAAGLGSTVSSGTGSAGGASSVVSGTKTITTMTANGGVGGQELSGGTAATASGGTAVNTSGNIDATNTAATVYPPAGVNANTGATPANGDGGAGKHGNGLDGTAGLVAFYYT